ncbi:MAG: histidyl-tRNA synthetase [Parcubacteria group bacterium Athens0714_25]|nr:MAG: histidyl-tRNA synthetase [Parcubacteria group bacterium Athens0714_25]
MPKKKTVLKKVKPSAGKQTKKSGKKGGANTIPEEPILLQTVRGMHDILPGEQPYWNQVRNVLEKSCQKYGYQRIDVPVLEYANIFIRSIGEGTDVVDKELYSFVTRGKDKVALRPEFTAGIARAYIQHGMNVYTKPVKLFSIGPVYRYDRPQEGRYREHWQANFDVFGEDDPILDAQVFQLADGVLNSLGIKGVQFQVNSIGCPQCRKEYLQLLVSYFESKKQKLCKDCKNRLEINPLRVLDCKEDKCAQVAAGAPQTVDHLCIDCRTHFKSLLEYLDELELSYAINPHLVRGLDYYTRTVFEIWTLDEGGKKHSLGGGGRYNGLIETIGGENTPAIGFGLGIERLVIEMKRINAKSYKPPRPRVFLAQLGSLAKKKSLRLFSELEKNGILTAESFGRGSLKSQLRVANRLGVEITLIIGQKEALDETVIVKNMATGTQETMTQAKLNNAIKKIFKSKLVIRNGNGGEKKTEEEKADKIEELN